MGFSEFFNPKLITWIIGGFMHQHKKDYHQILSDYFIKQPNFFDPEMLNKPNRRKCIEQTYQQSQGEFWDQLKETLWDYGFINAKVKSGLVYELITDYNPVNKDERFKLLQSALRLSAHVLFSHPDELPEQLFGRLTDRKEKAFQELKEKIQELTKKPWLRTCNSCLISTGGPLVCTLTGHLDGLRGVALTPDGRRDAGWETGCLGFQ